VVRGERFKYVHFAAEALPDLLFDIVADPDQLENLADDPVFAAVRADCAAAALSWRMRHGERALTDTVITPAGPRTRYDHHAGS
jgi:arylsulfatase A-like enzyme